MNRPGLTTSGLSLHQSLEKSFLNRAQSVFFGRLALYSTYFLLWLFSLFSPRPIFPTTIWDLLLIMLAFSLALLTYNYKEQQTISRWGHFLTLIFDLFIHLFFSRSSGFLLSPLMIIHPVFSASFLLLFHNLLMLIAPLLSLPIAMALCLMTDPRADAANLLALVILNLGLDLFMVFIINHPHGYEQRLAQEMVAIEKKLTELSILKERQRISREFHDGAGAKITSIIMQCEYLERMGQNDRESLLQIKESAVESIDDMRRSIAFLNGQFDIVEQIELMLEKMRIRHRFSTTSLGTEELRNLNPEEQIASCRIIQEGLTNALKHAQASKVSILVEKKDDILAIAIADNGTGFDVKTKKEQGFGLKNMLERARQMGGKLQICSNSGQGCKIVCEIPTVTAPSLRL